MGFTLQGLGAAASGAVEGRGDYINQASVRDQTSRANAEENRNKVTEQERLETRRRQQEINDEVANLAQFLNPTPDAPVHAAQNTPPAGAPQGIPTGSPGTPPAGASQGIPTGSPGTPPIAPPQGGGIPAPGPTGTPPIAPPQDGALPVGDQAAALPPPPQQSRRDRIQASKDKAVSNAIRLGGIEAGAKINDYYDTQIRGQMFDYAYQGALAYSGDGKNEGGRDAVSAAKLLNTALELSPTDKQIEFRAVDGVLVGSRNGQDVEYSPEHIAGFVEKMLVKPENLKEWRELWQDDDKIEETARSAMAQELLKRGELDNQANMTAIAGSNAITARGYLDLAEELLPAQKAQIGAEIYASLRTADAGYMRAQGGAFTKLSHSEKIRLQMDILKSIENSTLNAGQQWMQPLMANPGASEALKSGTIDLAMLNLESGEGNFADALAISAIAFAQVAGITPDETTMNNITGLGENEAGQAIVVWNGKDILITPTINALLKQLLESQK